MAVGAPAIAQCGWCGGPHPTGMCLTWIVAHDAGTVEEVPERHIHCERCCRGRVVTLAELQDSSRRGTVQRFIAKHAHCKPRR